MSVTREQIRRIAELAELAVDDAAAAELEVQLNRILGYVEQLGELPKDDTAHDERAVTLRRDEPSADTLLDRPNHWAPAMKGDLFVVPRLGEGEGPEEEE
ncbi:MAG TPA: Asp-tRNA(Asn)/Glu-tRNA(Gln) amidotransferase subunit GatC [Gemmatimonadales bacterium]|jgi:aspartyl-tRNA(Asn)/glutamyl-tRNA(Gln) amidotransferase subunit C